MEFGAVIRWGLYLSLVGDPRPLPGLDLEPHCARQVLCRHALPPRLTQADCVCRFQQSKFWNTYATPHLLLRL